MKSGKAGKRVRVLFYLLTAYILLQFVWWAVLLIKLNLDLHGQSDPDLARLKIWMVAGEGAVFLIILIIGLVLAEKSIRKEMLLVRQQRNFLLSITHELKTPLAAIQLCLDTLTRHPGLSNEKRNTLEKNASENTDRLRLLIDNVLMATRIDSGQEMVEKTRINLSELTEQIVKRLNHTLGMSPEAATEIEPEITGLFDKHSYETILINLVENAHKYAVGERVLISLSTDGHMAVLSVADSGPGIPADSRQRIFEKFYRLGNEETRSKKGTGLGLYIVRELVELNKGSIRIENHHPRGSVFIVKLPLN